MKVQVGEAAQLLGVSRDTVRRRAEKKRFDEKMVGAEWIESESGAHWLIEVAESSNSGKTFAPLAGDSNEPAGASDQPVEPDGGYTSVSFPSDPPAELDGVVIEELGALRESVKLLTSERDFLRDRLVAADRAEHELRVLLQQRQEVLQLQEGELIELRRPWWRRLFGE